MGQPLVERNGPWQETGGSVRSDIQNHCWNHPQETGEAGEMGWRRFCQLWPIRKKCQRTVWDSVGIFLHPCVVAPVNEKVFCIFQVFVTTSDGETIVCFPLRQGLLLGDKPDSKMNWMV